MENIPSYLLGFLVTITMVWSLKPAARFFGLVDQPGGRKKHAGEIPLVGGLAMFAGILVAVAALGQPPLASIKGLLLGGALVLIVGTIDDLKPLSPLTRFLTQIVAAYLMISIDGVVLGNLGFIFGDQRVYLGSWAIPVTIFATVGVINATNMADGLDGLAGGLFLVMLTGLGIMAGFNNTGNLFYLFPVLIAVIAAFLYFNLRSPWREKASIFMGNGGSMLLGFISAWLLIKMSQTADTVITPVSALWLFALPLLDTVCVMLRRVLRGRSPFAPDREHFHHILLLAGYSVKQSVGIMLVLASLLAGFGLLGQSLGIGQSSLFAAFMIIFALYFWGMNHAWKVMKAIRRIRPHNEQHSDGIKGNSH